MARKRPKPTYEEARLALLTQHAKERVLAPLFADKLRARVEVVGGFDTDALGTFTRDVARVGSQLEAARRKAEIAIERSGLEIGLGSEGAFVPGPFGLGSWNIELLVLLDHRLGLEIVGRAQAAGLHVYGAVKSRDELAAIAGRASFPGHGLVVRPDDERDPRVRKGVADWPALERAFEEARRASASGAVFVESDLRAHMHPTRMATIREAGRDLVERLASACPGCGLPGFGAAGAVPGLPCADCGAPTREAIAIAFGCVRCDHREERGIPDRRPSASPAVCDYCNP